MHVLEWSHRTTASWAIRTKKGRGRGLTPCSSRCYCKDSFAAETCYHPNSKLPPCLEDLIPNVSITLCQDPNRIVFLFDGLCVSVCARSESSVFSP